MEHTMTGQSNGKMKHTVKDSVFTDLFSAPKYLLQLYKALHPEDGDVVEGDLKTVTLENVITDGIYNDVGFTKGNKLLVLTEAQTTWTANVIIRVLEYLVHSYRRYFLENRMDLYQSKKVALPKPEIYVIYAGKRKKRPPYISLSEEFFGGEETAVEVTVKMIYDGEDGDIINQYISFTKVLDREAQIYGRTESAVRETIRICKDRNILREYLEKKESEVVDIMMQLYDQEEIMRVHVMGKCRDAAICAIVETYQDLGMTSIEAVNKIAEKFSLSKERAEEEVSEYWKE
ncbi:MAG: hypothetical protein OSJ44_15115 [Lachnospiraceae bacterium]|nr:hypothetical protein [Lachnospiraceae bacterium]